MRARAAVLASFVAGVGSACASSDRAAPERNDQLEQATTTVCPKTTVEGLDVSGGQGVIDWAKVKASGREFAFIKATQGDYYTSNHWTDQWTGAKAAGLLRSPYHFFDGTIDGVAQAKHFLSVVGALGPGDLPPMLDIECPTSSNQSQTQSNCEYTGDSGWVAPATLNQRIHDWLDYVKQQTGMTPIVYSYNSWFQDSGMDSTTLVGKYPFYVSWPATNGCYEVGIGNAFTSATFWQWSVTGSCPGVTGTVDLDRFVGTLADLRGLAGLDADGGVIVDAGAADAKADAPAQGGGDAGASDDGGGSGGIDAEAGADPGAIAAASTASSTGGCAVARPRSPNGFWWIAAGVIAIAGGRRRRRDRAGRVF